MKDNATFIEFATFFFIIAFSASMTKLQWDYKADLKQQKVDRENRKYVIMLKMNEIGMIVLLDLHQMMQFQLSMMEILVQL